MKYNSLLASILALALLVTACGPKKGNPNDSDEFDDAGKSLKEQIPDVVNNLPAPTEIPYLIASTGAEFNASLVNDKSKAQSYGAKTEKAALNLGVYAADIGYLSSYEKTQETIDYITACKGLADNLGIMGSFDIDMMKKFEANVANKDSMASLLNQTIKKADKYLRDDSRNKLAVLIVTGGFVEGLSISTGLVKSYPKDLSPADRNLILTPVMRIILKQKESVNDLVNMLAGVDQVDPVPSILADLKTLQAHYKELNIEDQIKNNRGDLVLSDKNLVGITDVAAKLRKDITE